MRYGKKPRLSSRDVQLLVLIGIITGAVLGTLIGADIQLSRSVPGGGGFFAPWQGSRAFLFRSTSPYSHPVTALTQEQTYGRLALPGENPYILQLPFFLVPLYFPFAFFSDPATARGVWMFIEEAALVGAAFLTFRLIEWKPGRAFQAVFALLSVFGVYAVMALSDAGPAILLGLLYVAVLYAYATEQDELAGALLTFCLFAWAIGLPFVVLILWRIFYEKRWRALAGLVMTLLLLGIVSFLIYPGWVFPFIAAQLELLRASFGTTSGAILQRLMPGYGPRLPQAVTVLVILLILYEWAATRHADVRRLIWAAFLTLALTPLLGFRLEAGNLVVIVPALALICAAVASRWRTGSWLALLILLAAIILPWAWFIRWYVIHDPLAYDALLIFLPSFAAVGLYWTRWWFVRPPRTWLDHVRSSMDIKQGLPPRRRTTSPME